MVQGGRHILHVFPGFDAGGTQMRTVQLMGMLPPGVRHTILAMDDRYGGIAHVPAGVGVATLPAPPRLSFWRMGRYLADLIAAQRPDAVMTYNWGSIEAVLGVRRLGFAPLIHHEDGFGPEEAQRFLRRRIWIRRWLLRSAAVVVVPSRVLEDLAVRRWRQPKNRVCYLPNGVDLERFRPAPAPAPEPVGRHAPEGRPVVIGHVAHLRPEKNQRLLLAAMARMTWRAATVLRIVGDGPEAGRLRTTVDQLGITQQVEFVGKVADTAPVYRDFDLFVLSSDTEQMPLTVLEAMASGLPVVSTDVGDVRSMVHATNRQFITPKGDVAALAGALDHLVTDAATRRTLGEHNRVHCAQHFDKAACYRAWVELYAGYLRTHPA